MFAIIVCASTFTACSQDDTLLSDPSQEIVLSNNTVGELGDSLMSGITTRSVGSGIDLKPDASWSTVASSGSKIRIFKSGDSYRDTYVIAVDLSTGAKVAPYYELASGETTATSSNPDPRFKKFQLSYFNMSSLNWFAVTNLSFFGDRHTASSGYSYTKDHSSFVLKKNGTIVSCGYGTYDAYEPNNKRVLIIQGSAATVISTSSTYTNCTSPNSGWESNLYNKVNTTYSGLDNVIMGLHPTLANKSKYSSIGRTFLGVRQKNPLTNGGPAYVYILVSNQMTQAEAYATLQDFSCDASEIIMFDGSGSTRMKTASGITLSPTDGRSVPIWLAVKES